MRDVLNTTRLQTWRPYTRYKVRGSLSDSPWVGRFSYLTYWITDRILAMARCEEIEKMEISVSPIA
jgi:hypothetical protein